MRHIHFPVWFGLITLAMALLACSNLPRLFPSATATPSATPAARPGAILPTAARAATQPAPTAAATPSEAAPRPATPTRDTSTPDPHLIVVTDEDIARAIMAGAGTEQGLSAQGFQVHFSVGKMTLAAEELRLGPVQVKQLVMVGRLVAENGELHFESESVSPRGLVTNLLPTLADQALSRFAARWYVEEVRLLDGRLELRIR